jgi:hypothetical protein
MVRDRSGERRRSSATSRASRQARTGTIAPTTTAAHCDAANVGPRRAIGIAARNVGNGSQTSKAARGNTNGGVW